LVRFDLWTPPFGEGAIRRRTLREVLSAYLERVASEGELDEALAPLLERGFIESRGPYLPETMTDPLGRPFRVPPSLGDPDEGEEMYGPTMVGLRAARVCAPPSPTLSPWLLGNDRVDDQILVACSAMQSCSPVGAEVLCALTPRDEIDRGFERLLAAQLLEKDSKGAWRLSLEGKQRARELSVEMRDAVFGRVAWVGSATVPTAVSLAPSRKLEILKAMTEADLTQRVIMPLLEAMGFKRVTYNNGPGERGKDVIACKDDELGHPSWIGVAVKATDLSGSASDRNNSCTTLATQILQAANDAVHVPPSAQQVHLERVWVVTSGLMPTESLSKVRELLAHPGLGRTVRWVPGADLVTLIDARHPTLWAGLASDE
jgi:hypothetical protein